MGGRDGREKGQNTYFGMVVVDTVFPVVLPSERIILAHSGTDSAL